MVSKNSQYHQLPDLEDTSQAYELSNTFHPRKPSNFQTDLAGHGSIPQKSARAPSQILTSRLGWALEHFSGWKMGVTLSAALVGIILLVNVSFLVWAMAAFQTKEGLGTLKSGSCDQLKKANTWIHLIINILSTGMLGGSNFSMQRLSAPTREEVDRAHLKSRWLDIGVLSLRNLRSIGPSRVLIWSLLATSSIPIHLLYNSAVFSQIGASDYDMRFVTEDFANGMPISTGAVEYHSEYPLRLQEEWQSYLKSHTFVRKTTEDCVKIVLTNVVTSWKTFYMVDRTSGNSSALNYIESGGTDIYESAQPLYQRLCQDQWSCTKEIVLAQKAFTANSLPISYCLIEPMPEHCELRFSTGIIAVVILCNIIKFASMVATVRLIRSQGLVTLGDAVSSFLQLPDDTTRARSLASKSSIIKLTNSHKRFEASVKWRNKSRFWFRAASPLRWVVTNALCALGILIMSILLAWGLRKFAKNEIISLGFGVTTPETVITGEGSPDTLVSSVLLANLPQLLLSMVYLTYNAIFTCAYVSTEWNEFGFKRKRLRVTQPLRGQKSTYYLSLPYACGIPLLTMSVLLHWLFSQSIFLVDIQLNDAQASRVTRLGWSPMAAISSVVVALLVTLSGVAMGFRKLKPGIPLAGTCSAAISAACHARSEEVPDLVCEPIQWGVVSVKNGVGHCAFSSEAVEFPNEETEYD